MFWKLPTPPPVKKTTKGFRERVVEPQLHHLHHSGDGRVVEMIMAAVEISLPTFRAIIAVCRNRQNSKLLRIFIAYNERPQNVMVNMVTR